MQIHFGPDPELKARFADGTVIADTRLVDERFDDLEARGLTFSGVTLTRCTFRGCRFDDLTFRDVRLRDVRFEQCVFAGSTWEAVDGAKVRVEDCRFVRRRPKDEPEGAEADPEAGRCVFRDVSLTDATLKGAHLDGTRWTRVAFHDGKLGASFVGARFVDATFTAEEQVDFSGADFTDAELDRRVFAGANLYAARLPKDLAGVDFGGANLAGAKLEGADLRGADLRSASLAGAELEGANLSGADLTSASLTGAKLRGANLRRARLPRASLTEADLSEADLSGAAMVRAVCTSTRFNRATLDRASLKRARCNLASFVGASARGCDFLKAELGGADLRDAIFDGSRLRGAFSAHANLRGTRARWVWMPWSMRLALVRANAKFALPSARDFVWLGLGGALFAAVYGVATVEVPPGTFLAGLRAFTLGSLAFLGGQAWLRAYLGLFAGFRAVGPQPWAFSPLPPLLAIRPAPRPRLDRNDEQNELRELDRGAWQRAKDAGRADERLSKILRGRYHTRKANREEGPTSFAMYYQLFWILYGFVFLWMAIEDLPGSAEVRRFVWLALGTPGVALEALSREVNAAPNPAAARVLPFLFPFVCAAWLWGCWVVYRANRRGWRDRHRLNRSLRHGVRGTLARPLQASAATDPKARVHLAEDFPRLLSIQRAEEVSLIALMDICWATANPRLDRARQGRPEAILHAEPGDRVWFDDSRSPAVLFTAPPDVDVRSRMAFWTVNLLLHGLPFALGLLAALGA